jgi:hypothetical protein
VGGSMESMTGSSGVDELPERTGKAPGELGECHNG